MSNPALRTDGVNDFASFTGAPAINAGTSAYVWWFKGTLRQTPAGLCGIVGASSTSSSNPSGFATNTNLRLLVYHGGTICYGTPNNFFIVGEYHHYRVEHDADGAWRAYRDDMVTPVASGSFSSNRTFNTLDQMFRSSSNSSIFLAADVEEMGLQSGAFSEVWQAALSGGTGNILPTQSGNNKASLINFPTDNSQWINFATSVDAVVDLIKGLVSVKNKNLFSIAGSNVNFLKSQIFVNLKSLLSVSDSIIDLQKEKLLVSNKQLVSVSGSTIDAIVNLQKQKLIVKNKNVNLKADNIVSLQKNILNLLSKEIIAFSDSFVNLQKSKINILNKQLNVDLSIDAIVNLQKGKALILNKQIYLYTDGILNLNKTTLNVINKLLVDGNYLIFPVSSNRIFKIENSDFVFNLILPNKIFEIKQSQRLFNIENEV